LVSRFSEQHSRLRTLILAVYAAMVEGIPSGMGGERALGFFARPCGEISPRIRQLALDLAADTKVCPDSREEL
jgi:hypothetical protein